MAGASIHLLNRRFLVASALKSAQDEGIGGNVQDKRVLILGGTGRVGSSTAIALKKLCPSLRFIIAGRDRQRGSSVVSTLGENAKFLEVDIDNIKSLEAAFNGVDMVVHTAGPFQRAENCNVLNVAISSKTPYVDVCDDADYAWRAKSFHAQAVAAGVPAITTAGIYPGVSNVMAAELVRAARTDKKNGEPERLRFFYYTAGTGGAGPTILTTSFLLLGEDVTAYSQGKKMKLKPYSGMMKIDFGKGIGKRDVYLFNLPEVSSTHKVLGVPSVSARFGTAPFFWNWGMIAFGKLLPAEFLQDRNKVQRLVQIFDPIVRATDSIVGERVSMRVDLECSNERTTVGIFSHKKLSVSVGMSTAAFALSMLEGNTQPGVWFPEEEGGIPVEEREMLLQRASMGTFNFVMNKSPWMVETNPKELGLGIYI
ncbi:saccharopine dehydrogenase [Wolffia australiana]